MAPRGLGLAPPVHDESRARSVACECIEPPDSRGGSNRAVVCSHKAMVISGHIGLTDVPSVHQIACLLSVRVLTAPACAGDGIVASGVLEMCGIEPRAQPLHILTPS